MKRMSKKFLYCKTCNSIYSSYIKNVNLEKMVTVDMERNKYLETTIKPSITSDYYRCLVCNRVVTSMVEGNSMPDEVRQLFMDVYTPEGRPVLCINLNDLTGHELREVTNWIEGKVVVPYTIE